VRMRRRKPWVLARRRLLGWNVRLLTGKSLPHRRTWTGQRPRPHTSTAVTSGHERTAGRSPTSPRYGGSRGRSNEAPHEADWVVDNELIDDWQRH
jgi:hypothetical protein